MKPFNVFPYDRNFDFMRMRWVALVVAALLTLVAIGAMVTRGFNFALDFTGGVGVELRYDKAPDVDVIRENLERAGHHGALVQTFGGGTDLLVRLRTEAQRDPDDAVPHPLRGQGAGRRVVDEVPEGWDARPVAQILEKRRRAVAGLHRALERAGVGH